MKLCFDFVRKGRTIMKDESRVLNRAGARNLIDRECEQVLGAIIHTQACSINLSTCTLDGDCEQTPC